MFYANERLSCVAGKALGPRSLSEGSSLLLARITATRLTILTAALARRPASPFRRGRLASAGAACADALNTLTLLVLDLIHGMTPGVDFQWRNRIGFWGAFLPGIDLET